MKDEEIEKAVLGVLMTTKEHLNIIPTLDIDLFTDENNRVILSAIKDIFNQTNTIDVFMVANKCKHIMAFVFQCHAQVSSDANFDYHLAVLKELKLRRDIKTLINQSIPMVELTDIFKLRENMIKTLEKMISIQSKKELRLNEIVGAEITKIEEHQKSSLHNETIGINTGFRKLNEITGGWKSSLIIIAARPAVGKSSLGLQIAKYPAENGIPTMCISVEMTNSEIVGRVISSSSDVPLSAITNANLSENQWTKVVNTDFSIPMYLDDDENLNLDILKMKLREYVRLYGIKLFVIDYIQLIENSGAKGNREREVAEISRTLKKLSKELDLPIIALAQLSRASEQEKREPKLSDLRESGSIEQDANMVMFIQPISDVELPEVQVDLIIAKNRGGKIGRVKMNFLKNYQKFVEIN